MGVSRCHPASQSILMSVVVRSLPPQGNTMECEAEEIEIPVVFLTSSDVDDDVVEESGPVEQATSKNVKEGGGVSWASLFVRLRNISR